MTRKNKLYIIAIFLSIINLSEGFATNSMRPITTDSRIRTLVYSPNEVFDLRFRYGFQSFIEFGEDEDVDILSVGESFNWKIVPAGRRLFIKPMDYEIHTNMTVITTKRIYYFDIYSAPEKESLSNEIAYVVRFFYPDTNTASNNQVDPSLIASITNNPVSPEMPILAMPQSVATRNMRPQAKHPEFETESNALTSGYLPKIAQTPTQRQSNAQDETIVFEDSIENQPIIAKEQVSQKSKKFDASSIKKTSKASKASNATLMNDAMQETKTDSTVPKYSMKLKKGQYNSSMPFKPDPNMNLSPTISPSLPPLTAAGASGPLSKILTDKMDSNDFSAKNNYSYSIAGKAVAIEPIKLFDDGVKSYFQFPDNNLNIPIISAVDLHGNEQQLTTRIEGQYVVVDGVELQFSLRLADKLICVFNNAFVNGASATQ